MLSHSQSLKRDLSTVLRHDNSEFNGHCRCGVLAMGLRRDDLDLIRFLALSGLEISKSPNGSSIESECYLKLM